MVEWGVGEDKEVEEWGTLVGVEEDQEEEEEEEVPAPVLILWHVTSVQGAWPFGP